MTRTTLVVLAVLALGVSFANANTINYDGVGLHGIVTVHAPGSLIDNLTVYAGQMLYTYGTQQYSMYCVDINHWAGTTQVEIEPASALPNGFLAAYLYDTYATSVDTNLEAAALASALWEVLNETGPTFDLTSGGFMIAGNDEVAGTANGLLANLPTSYFRQGGPEFLHSTEGKQSMLVDLPGVSVPEPMSMGLLSAGALVGLVRRRK
jgi:hypothetical protein